MQKPSERTVRLFEPTLGVEEEDAVLAVLRRGWVSMGEEVEGFEAEFARQVGVDYAVAVNSCTAALHIAGMLADLGPGDEVIVPSLTFVATANAVLYTGTDVVFADIAGEDDWTIDPDHVESLINGRTKAVIAMHYAGAASDMDRLVDLCDRHGLHLIEDACHGLGSSLGGRPLGSIGAVGCFSFYSNKIMTTAEGGMITTNDADFARRCRLLRAHGLTNTAVDRVRGAMAYDVVELGYNYRLDDLRAAIGRVQLGRLPRSVARRRMLAVRYDALLDGANRVARPRFGSRTEPAHYIYPILLAADVDRDAVRRRMADLGVQTSIHYAPVHLFEHYRKRGHSALPRTEDIAARALTLPLYPDMRDDDPDFVVDVLTRAVRECA